ncbi:superfamily I DNA/RNA helicase/RecB family exonuclease [Promicromonospora sukumoe]|uniref:DNA 3'-5' helicase n=1 Tax=Promicromonospora sukumoe TaxID=88382 RepID=A0A7W3JF25_9MICO|nr:ATP-dependent DNA helicase [Promicromonospora sukumoe]MBA8811645.1 superfamily I DNA/RNA helicase/RecB family exonuclease [Promicromonospora sukumoe]
MTPTLTLAPRLAPPGTRPDGAGSVLLDDGQAAAVESALSRPATLVLGAPGSGKTTVTCEVAVRALLAGVKPERVLVLASSRRAAARLRDEVAAQAGRTVGAPMVRTASSAAFAVLRTRAAALGQPTPTLVSGPEQDLVLAELLAGHVAGEGRPLALPAGLPEESLGLRGLRQELRDLLMRAAERGLGPVELDEMGRANDRPEWVMAAQLYEEYLDTMTLRLATPDAGPRYDPAVVIDEAAESLRSWEDEVPGTPRPTWDLVVVDDYQEATAATVRLLRVLHDDGARLVLLSDPDSAVQTFRGAAPGLTGRAAAPAGPGREFGAFDAETVVLGTVWRQAPELRAVTRAVTNRIPVSASAMHRRAVARADQVRAEESRAEGSRAEGPRADDDASGETPSEGAAVGSEEPTPASVQVAVLAGAAQEAAWIARELRAEHLLHGTPWDRMAVIARSGTRLAALRRELVSASVPVALLGSDLPLRDEPAVAPLLAAVKTCAGAPRGSLEALIAEELDGEEPVLDPETAALLLVSPIGGLDAVALRRLRRALRAEELSAGGGRTSDALLVEVLADPARAALLPTQVRRGPLAVARVLAAGREAAGEPGATAQTVLWAAWAATGLAERWSAAALAGGPAGLRADRDLDSVLALFRAAETFVDRMPGAPVAAFVDYLASQDLPADSLAASAQGAGAVEALTPPGAAGREWDVVVVAGVQDGVWPDLRLRDSLLGSQALVELIAGRSDDGRVVGAEARRQVLTDELRAFAVAVSRARRRLLVTAVEDTEEAPSVFCDLVSPRDDGGDGPDPRRVQVGPPLDLRGVVAAARSELVRTAAGPAAEPAGASHPAHPAAALLADLAAAAVAEADPSTWYGVAGVSSEVPLWGAQDIVTVSPSKVETVTTCALRWAFESAGGTKPDATHQSLGTLLHSIAQSHPRGSLTDLNQELDRRWPELALPDGWPSLQLRKRAERMVIRLAEYLGDSGEPLLVEADFDLRVDRARLRGQVDRVEDAGDGSVTVADLKTGKTAASKDKAAENPQLGAYQLAVEEGALDLPEGTVSKGASLVYVGTETVSASVRNQPALAPDAEGNSWARETVEGAADTMAAAKFAAKNNDLCEMCGVRRSCPLQPEGRKVVE